MFPSLPLTQGSCKKSRQDFLTMGIHRRMQSFEKSPWSEKIHEGGIHLYCNCIRPVNTFWWFWCSYPTIETSTSKVLSFDSGSMVFMYIEAFKSSLICMFLQLEATWENAAACLPKVVAPKTVNFCWCTKRNVAYGIQVHINTTYYYIFMCVNRLVQNPFPWTNVRKNRTLNSLDASLSFRGCRGGQRYDTRGENPSKWNRTEFQIQWV